MQNKVHVLSRTLALVSQTVTKVGQIAILYLGSWHSRNRRAEWARCFMKNRTRWSYSKVLTIHVQFPQRVTRAMPGGRSPWPQGWTARRKESLPLLVIQRHYWLLFELGSSGGRGRCSLEQVVELEWWRASPTWHRHWVDDVEVDWTKCFLWAFLHPAVGVFQRKVICEKWKGSSQLLCKVSYVTTCRSSIHSPWLLWRWWISSKNK